MANKNNVKPEKATTPVVMTSDNVMDVINAKNLGSSEMATKIQEELKNEQDERIKEMKKTRFSRASRASQNSSWTRSCAPSRTSSRRGFISSSAEE